MRAPTVRGSVPVVRGTPRTECLRFSIVRLEGVCGAGATHTSELYFLHFGSTLNVRGRDEPS